MGIISNVMTFFSKKIFYFLLINLLLCSTIASHAITNWTALVYVQAKNNLNPFAIKNFTDMATIGSNSNANLLVQWYQPGTTGVWRYKIAQGKMILDECSQSETDGNAPADLVDSMRWAVRKFPAQKYSLILWNHGIGVLDPQWGRGSGYLVNDFLGLGDEFVQTNPRLAINGVTVQGGSVPLVQHKVDVQQIVADAIADTLYATVPRGILFNEESKTYMNNQSLVQALKDIKTNVLGDKKLDLLGMDACLMAMVEVAYQARQYVNLFVGSQEVEMAHGWDYAALAQLFSAQESTAHSVAHGIVASYEKVYKDKIHFHTQSAISLHTMDHVKASIDNFVKTYRSCRQKSTLFADMVLQARKACVQFSAASYIDLHSFYSELSNALHANASTPGASDLRAAVSTSMRALESAVIANTVGKNMTRARGLSIYFPQGYIDASYLKTDFARECLWYQFIQEVQ